MTHRLRFLAIGGRAAQALVQDRFAQSTDFEAGRELALFLLGRLAAPGLSSQLGVVQGAGGAFLLAKGAAESDLIVFDLEQAEVFGGLNEREALLVLQRVLRFAVRYWGNQNLAISDHLIQGTTRAAVFPFPISRQSSFRLVIEREPDRKRITKRAAGSHYLLIYACGTDDSVGGEPSYTVFRKAFEALDVAVKSLAADTVIEHPADTIKTLSVTALEPALPNIITDNLGVERWLYLLTDTQRRFVHAPLTSPHRIEGPAGSGKSLCLTLKCLQTVREAVNQAGEHHSLFVTHSEATKRSIRDLLEGNDDMQLVSKDKYLSPQSIMVTTLHELSGDLLRTDISESEFLDRDAMESKNVQLLHILESLEEAIQHDLHTHKRFLSPSFALFLESEDKWSIAQLLQHEIAVVIKGRAGEDLEKYKRLTRPLQGLPMENDADRGFAFLIFSSYQRKLREAGQFDTDDIVLSAVGQLDTPIWRRRRAQEGFDSVFIDETHLFNLNELSVFHFLTRSETAMPIAYSVDRSQAIGDRGWTAALFEEALRRPGVATDGTTVTGMTAVFRCSPDIVNLAFAVTSSGATLFANFEDPLKLAQSSFTENEERKCRPPEMRLYPNDESMVSEVFHLAEELADELKADRSAVAIVTFSDELFGSLRGIATSFNKPVEILRRWGDVEVIRHAKQSHRFVLGAADYIGGLEFDAVILVGVDGGRVPPTGMVTEDSRNFITFASLSRLYVAITRAKYRVVIVGTRERGPSALLSSALESKALSYAG